jgi:hypothetical protein
MTASKMALTLVDKVLSGNIKKPPPPPPTADGSGKRKRSESGYSSGSHRSTPGSSRNSGGDILPCFTRGGSRGGGRGGSRGSFPAHFSKRGGSRDSRYDKLDNRHIGGGRSSALGPDASAAMMAATALARWRWRLQQPLLAYTHFLDHAYRHCIL